MGLSKKNFRRVLGGAAAALFLSALPAHAQDEAAPVAETIPLPADAPAAVPAKAEGPTHLDAVEVTGSRIKRIDFEGAQPVTMIGRDDIERSGLTNIGDLLSKIAAAGATINTTFATTALSGGETNLDLRNLGSQRVLVLVNGHRWVNGLVATGTSAVDLNNIPVSVIDHIEVLKDGASAIYGSDAIAGVVNIITRKNFQGLEFASQYGMSEAGDGDRQQHDISFGRNFGKTNLFANLSFAEEAVIKTTTRDVSAYPGVGAGKTRLSSVGPNGLFQFVPNPVNGAQYACPGLNGTLATGLLLPNDPGLGPIIDSVPAGLQLCKLTYDAYGTQDIRAYNPDTDGYNRYKNSNLQNPSKRSALFVQVTHDLLDNLSFSFEGLYNNRRSQSQLRPQALQVGDLAGSDIYVARDNIYNPFGQDIGKGDGVLTPQLGLGIGSGVVGLRLEDRFPPVITTQDYDTLRLGASLAGDFSIISQGFTWEAGYSYSSNKRTSDVTGDYRKDRLKLALGPAADCTGDCVAFNAFNGQAGVTQAMVDYIAIYAHNKGSERQDDVYANFSTVLDAIPLPAGPVAIAFGLEYRRDEFHDDPDDILEAGLSSGNNSVRTDGDTDVKEAYIEFGVPLLRDLAFAQEVDLSLAGRVSSYQRFGATETGKAGLRWKINDEVLLRGTYSTAFRAPNVGELFLGDSDSFDSVSDPCATDQRNDPATAANCDADGVPDNVTEQEQVRAIFGGNTELKPEKATTMTYGLVYSPSFVPDLTVNVDYYNIKLKDYITNVGSQFVLDSCYNTANRGYCEFVHRTGTGSLDYLESRLVNYAGVDTAGIDFGFDYTLPVPAEYGKFMIDLDGSYLIQYDQTTPTATGGTVTEGYVGTNGSFIGVPRWKANSKLIWKVDRFTASLNTRMVYKQNEDCVDGLAPSFSELGLCSDPKMQDNGDGTTTDVSENKLKTVFYNDVQFSYDLRDDRFSVALGVNNVLDQDPPISRNPTTGAAYFNYDVLQYEIPGRFWYLRAGMHFN